jgi:predicted transcriptional regulator
MATTRERIRELLDTLPDDRLEEAEAFIRDLAIPDDDEPYTDEDLAAVAEGREEYRRGETIPHDEAMRSIGL